MIPLGDITVGPNSGEVAVGSFSLAEGDDTIWFEVQRTSPDQGWPWSYGILSWRTAFGAELGSIKAYAAKAGERYRLSVGLPPRALTGTVYYEPRGFNLAWIQAGYVLSLSFAAEAGSSVVKPQAVAQGSVAYPVEGGQWKYAADSGLIQVQL